MITSKETLINQLLGTVYPDKDDKTIYHINMDNALRVLINSGLIIPKKQYELTLERMLNQKILGAPTGSITKLAMAELMLGLALEMAISKEEILKFNMTDQQQGK